MPAPLILLTISVSVYVWNDEPLVVVTTVLGVNVMPGFVCNQVLKAVICAPACNEDCALAICAGVITLVPAITFAATNAVPSMLFIIVTSLAMKLSSCAINAGVVACNVNSTSTCSPALLVT